MPCSGLIPFDFANIIDYGNIDTYGMFDLSAEMEHALEHYREIVCENHILPFMWGGDHTVTVAPLMTLGETITRQWVPGTPQWENYLIAWREADFAECLRMKNSWGRISGLERVRLICSVKSRLSVVHFNAADATRMCDSH